MLDVTLKKKSLKNTLAEIFWDELGDTIRQEKLADNVYHYTNLDGLKGILISKQIWMTNSDFLNDKSELTYFFTLIEDAKDMFKESVCSNSLEELSENSLLYIFLNCFDEAIEKRINNADDKFKVYVMSLSENEDSLTLWGNYAKGKGYNLCFNAKSLMSKVDKIGGGYVVYGKVEYNRDVQLETLSSALYKTFTHLEKIESDSELERETLKKELLAYFNSLIISYSIFFKHHSFEPEEEFRVAYTTSESENIEFRTNDEAIIPFIKMKFDLNDINGIVIGPKNNSDIAEIGVRTYLDKLGYDLNTISVKKSIIPLRF